MDNDPSQTSAKSMATLMDMGYTKQKIPAKSSDLDPIGNVFHIVRKRINAQIKESNVTRQTWDEFKQMIQYNIWSTSRNVIDKTISSMFKRLTEIVMYNTIKIKVYQIYIIYV